MKATRLILLHALFGGLLATTAGCPGGDGGGGDDAGVGEDAGPGDDAGDDEMCTGDGDCAADEHCGAGGLCAPDACLEDALFCDGTDVRACAANGSGSSVVETCAAEQYCEDGQCRADACDEGQLFCGGGDVRLCNADGSGSEVEEDCGALDCQGAACVCTGDVQCEDDEHCDGGGCAPDVCEQGQTFCDGGDVLLCSDSGDGAAVIESCGALSCTGGACVCTSDAQCDAGEHCDPSGACVPDVCVEGAPFCDDGDAYQCAANGSGATLTEACGALSCAGGACVCTGDGQCAAGEHCSGGACVPDVCSPNAAFCLGGDAYLCNGSGSDSTLLEECGALACQGGACVCTSDAQCPAGEHCGAGGSCAPDVCPEGQLFCSGGDAYLCNGNGSGSSLDEDCGALTCQGGACVCTSDAQCAADEHCDGGACVADVCDQGQAFCSGGDAYLCDDDGAGSALLEACAPLDCVDGSCACTSHAQCDAGEHCSGGACVADVCAQGQTFCDGDDVRQCDAVGSGSTLLDACAPLVCQGGACACTDDAQCGAGEVCSGGACTSIVGVVATDYDVCTVTGVTDIELSGIAADAGGARFLAAPLRYHAINGFNQDVLDLTGADTLSLFLDGKADIAAHMDSFSSQMEAIAFAPDGSVVMADYSMTWDIVRAAPDGSMTTVISGEALAGVLGLADEYDIGFGVNLVVDGDGTIYYWAPDPMAIVRITAAGNASVHASFGADTDIEDIAVTAGGTLYAWDDEYQSEALYRISTTGTVTVVIDGQDVEDELGQTTTPAIAELVANPDGTLYGYDRIEDRILRINPFTGDVTEVVSGAVLQPLVTPPLLSIFTFIEDMAREPGGTLLVQGGYTDNLVRIDPVAGTAVEIVSNCELAGFMGQGGAEIDAFAVTASGDVYGWNDHFQALHRFDGAGSVATVATSDADFEPADKESPQMTLLQPNAIAVGPGDVLYLGGQDLMTFDPATGQVTHLVSDDDIEAAGGSSFPRIQSIAVGPGGEVYFYELGEETLYAYEGGQLSVLATFASFDWLTAMHVAPGGGTLYAVERSDDVLLRIDTSTGAVTTAITAASFDAAAGGDFDAGAMTALPDGDLAVFDEMDYATDNPESILRVDLASLQVTALLDNATLRAASAGAQVELTELGASGSILYGFDALGFDVYFWVIP